MVVFLDYFFMPIDGIDTSWASDFIVIIIISFNSSGTLTTYTTRPAAADVGRWWYGWTL